MSASALFPTPSTTLVIVLGASAWPNSPGFQASRAFMYAAQGFRNYVLDPQGFGLPEANLLDQFDAPDSASDQLELLGSFLERRTQALKAAKQAVRDVLVYFVGHGGFAGSSTDFYLLLHRTNASTLRASGIGIDTLADVLREKARQTRRYLFLDCCFAAAAFRAFQGGPDQTAITKTLDAFRVQAKGSSVPRKGTVLLCSSDQKSPSLLLPDESCTMFSYALLDVLKNGDLHRPQQLSLRDIKELAEDRLAALPEQNAPRPGLYSPDQSEGDAADIPFFPNPRGERKRYRQTEEADQAPGRTASISSLPPTQPVQAAPRPFPSIQLTTLLPFPRALLTYQGHVVGAEVIAWSPLGRHIASAGIDNTIHVWDATTGVKQLSYSGHSYQVRAIAWSPNGKRIASSSDRVVQVWDATTGVKQLSYSGHSYQVQAIAWSPDSKYIASGEAEQQAGESLFEYALFKWRPVHVWNAGTGEKLLVYGGNWGSLHALTWSPDGQRIASGSDELYYKNSQSTLYAYTVEVWEAATGKPLLADDRHPSILELIAPSTQTTGKQLPAYGRHTASVHGVAWSPDGQRIASGSADKTVQVWEAATGKQLLTYGKHTGSVYAVAWSPDGKCLASGSEDKTVQIWEAKTGKQLLTYGEHTRRVAAMAWSPDGRRIVSGSAQELLVWDTLNRNTLLLYQGHLASVSDVTWSPDGTRIASHSLRANTVQVWAADTGKKLLSYNGHRSYVQAMAWSPDGRYIASGSDDYTVQVWDAATGEKLLSYNGHMGPVLAVAWSPDGQRIASGSADYTVQVWGATTGEKLLTYSEHAKSVHTVAWSPDGTRIASSSDKAMQVWEAATGAKLLSYNGYGSYVQAMAWSPDGTRIASSDQIVQVWKAATGEKLLSYNGHGSYVRVQAMAWSPDGRYIASGSEDHTVQIWDAATGEKLLSYSEPSSVHALAWSPDGTRIASASYGVHVWQIA